MILRRLFAPFVLLAAVLISGCQSSNAPSLTPDDLNTDETDTLILEANLIGKDFIVDGIGEVTLRSTTDGDTARFNVGSVNVPVRFLGINTPESTGKIQPWGKAASKFTEEKLINAERIVLINDVDVFGQKDSSGGRYLGFVWYKPVDSSAFRLLNLELVEMAYTQNLMFEQSTMCDYYEAFQRAGLHAEATGARIYGEDDPSFDYSGQVYDISIRFARTAFGQTVPLRDREGNLVLDENEEQVMITLSDSTRVRLRAVIVGSIANNMILRDVYDPDDNGDFASIFLFTQYRDAPFQAAGDVVELYCKVTTFNDNVQLTDPELTTYSLKYPYTLITQPDAADYDEVLAQSGMTVSADPVDLTELDVDESPDFAPYNGFYAKAHITIRAVDVEPEDGYTSGTYWRKDANQNMTIYAYFYGTTVSFNLRVDGDMFPYIYETEFALEASYEVSGYIAPFYENYQLQLFNGAYITPLT